MDTQAAKYLNEFRYHLRSLSLEEREDAVNEIHSHITESQAAGKAIDLVLSDLGTPHELARAYLSNYHIRQIKHRRSFGTILKSSAFFTTTGFVSLLIVPILIFVILVCGVSTVLMPIIGVMRACGAQHVFVIWNTILVPRALGIPTGIVLGLICAGITRLGVKLLISYFGVVSKGYRGLLPNDIQS